LLFGADVHENMAQPSQMPTRDDRSTRLSPGEPVDARPTGRVLIADGDQTSRESLVAELRAAGFHVSVARTGFEAIVKASCNLPDLILLDANLPDIGAIETARMITTCPVTSHIPIVRVKTGRGLPKRFINRLSRRAG
jgi:CheY-like chemotaxis protein